MKPRKTTAPSDSQRDSQDLEYTSEYDRLKAQFDKMKAKKESKSYQQAYQAGFQEAVEQILVFLDELEMNQPQDLKTDNWRNWKYIRNSIVDTYLKPTPDQGSEGEDEK